MQNRNRILLAGAAIGAITGLVGAMMLVRRAEATDSETNITTGDGVKLGVLIFGLLRAIASLGDDK
jgi:hypothetical protein